jgi:hypothetical protein
MKTKQMTKSAYSNTHEQYAVSDDRVQLAINDAMYKTLRSNGQRVENLYAEPNYLTPLIDLTSQSQNPSIDSSAAHDS